MIEIDKEKQKSCSAILALKEVGVNIGRKDILCIKKWLNDNKITIYRLGKLAYVYKVDFDCAMILPQVKDFKRKYPMQWEQYYRKTIKDESLFNLIMLRLEVEMDYRPTTKVKRRSKSDEELYNKLMS